MAIFFKSTPIINTAKDLFEEALKTDPATISQPSVEAAKKAEEIARSARGSFSWGRLAVAIVLLLGILIAAIYTAQNDKLVDLYKLLLHSFELILGAVVGLLTGEAISR
ncbi:MAG: hypothetical protein HY752_05450 [Nitrospirae bacterium]|nr:hypothetical protein [Nitrospirota bacterium]